MPNDITPSSPIINYKDIVTQISNEIVFVWNEMAKDGSDEVKEIIKGIKQIIVTDEQFYRKQEQDKKLSKGTVYLVVRFGAGPTNYASSVVPITIQGLGIANQVKPVQLLLGTFSSYWTTKNLSQGLEGESRDQLQLWNTPEVISNFNVLDTDFRNLYRVTGNIVVGPAAIRVGTLTYYYIKENGVEGSEEINIMAFKDNMHTNMDSQPFGDTNGFAQSEANFSTYVFSVSTYLLNSQLAKDLLAMRGFRYRHNGTYSANAYDERGNPKFSLADNNKVMKIKLEFTNEFNNAPEVNNQGEIIETKDYSVGGDPVKGDDFYMKYKVVDSGISQEIGGIPSLTITFTR